MRFVALAIAIIVIGVFSLAQIRAFEPRDLIGEWSGQYDSRLGGTYRVYWIVTKVDGEQVSGTFHIAGRARYHNRDTVFVGSLHGNVFRAERVPTLPGEPSASWTFTIDEAGKTMKGTFHATATTELLLTKRK